MVASAGWGEDGPEEGPALFQFFLGQKYSLSLNLWTDKSVYFQITVVA